MWRTYTVPGDPAEGHESQWMARAAETWSGEWWHAGAGGRGWLAHRLTADDHSASFRDACFPTPIRTRAMRICLLTDQDLDRDGPLPGGDWPCDPRPYLPEAEWELAVLEKKTAVSHLLALSDRDFDLFFNLCDGAWGEGRPGIEVVQALEGLGVPFTGADSRFYEPSREAMKRVCHGWGIDTPAYAFASTDEEVERACDLLRFPLIVKHPWSYASVGLTRASRVETTGELMEQARRMRRTYTGALIEEFVEGTECTVLVAENPDDPRRPTTYTPLRYTFPEGESFKHSDVKWVKYHELEAAPVEDPELERRLRKVSADFFVGMNGAGYGRCDLRVDVDGRAWMLEINPNCGIYYDPEDAGSADLCLLNDPAGHEGFTRQIVQAALRRHARKSRSWTVQWSRRLGYGLHARRDIPVGQRILAFEERPHDLVTLSHVEESWEEPKRSWFDRCAWPLTDEVWVVWSRDPEEWRPVNHSCDPTAWLDGLDVVARRPLARGDEITLDYATFCNERMPSFRCECGTERCRGTIRGDDYLRDFVARYGDHVSDYVRRKRGRPVTSNGTSGR